MMKSDSHTPARIAMLIAALFATALVCPAADAFYAETTTTQSYSTFIGPIPISGLSFTIPAASTRFNAALVTLSLPNLFLSDNTSKTIPMAATTNYSTLHDRPLGFGLCILTRILSAWA